MASSEVPAEAILVIRITENLGCLEWAHLAYIEGEASVLDFGHFMHAHIVKLDRDHRIFMLYPRYTNELELPAPQFMLYMVKSLTL